MEYYQTRLLHSTRKIRFILLLCLASVANAQHSAPSRLISDAPTAFDNERLFAIASLKGIEIRLISSHLSAIEAEEILKLGSEVSELFLKDFKLSFLSRGQQVLLTSNFQNANRLNSSPELALPDRSRQLIEMTLSSEHLPDSVKNALSRTKSTHRELTEMFCPIRQPNSHIGLVGRWLSVGITLQGLLVNFLNQYSIPQEMQKNLEQTGEFQAKIQGDLTGDFKKSGNLGDLLAGVTSTAGAVGGALPGLVGKLFGDHSTPGLSAMTGGPSGNLRGLNGGWAYGSLNGGLRGEAAGSFRGTGYQIDNTPKFFIIPVIDKQKLITLTQEATGLQSLNDGFPVKLFPKEIIDGLNRLQTMPIASSYDLEQFKYFAQVMRSVLTHLDHLIVAAQSIPEIDANSLSQLKMNSSVNDKLRAWLTEKHFEAQEAGYELTSIQVARNIYKILDPDQVGLQRDFPGKAVSLTINVTQPGCMYISSDGVYNLRDPMPIPPQRVSAVHPFKDLEKRFRLDIDITPGFLHPNGKHIEFRDVSQYFKLSKDGADSDIVFKHQDKVLTFEDFQKLLERPSRSSGVIRIVM